MRKSNLPKLLALTIPAACLTSLSVEPAFAQVSLRDHVIQAQRAGSTPKTVSAKHQPTGTPHKASSFAPHPTKRRVFGAPIQAPIVTNVTPKKPRPK